MSQVREDWQIDVYPPCRGGRTLVAEGYIWEYCPDHPACNRWGYAPQHRLVLEQTLGRFLKHKHLVHHKDENRLNNAPGNLQEVTRPEHMRIHAQTRGGAPNRSQITEEQVRSALQGRSLKEACALLRVTSMTLRNRFPELLEPRKRRSPAHIDDAAVVEVIRRLAPDSALGYREIASRTGISFRSVQRICERNGIPWLKKTKKGEIHKTYRRTQPSPGD